MQVPAFAPLGKAVQVAAGYHKKQATVKDMEGDLLRLSVAELAVIPEVHYLFIKLCRARAVRRPEDLAEHDLAFETSGVPIHPVGGWFWRRYAPLMGVDCAGST